MSSRFQNPNEGKIDIKGFEGDFESVREARINSLKKLNTALYPTHFARAQLK
jgi:hypothetical protein